MVLQDVNGNGKKSPAADRWLRQRNGPRASAARCIFGPPEKRAHLAIIMRNEAEMERKRRDFAARYEPVGLSPAERSRFFEGLVKTAASPSSSSSPATSSHGHNNDPGSTKNPKADHQQNKQQHQKHGGSNQQSSDEDRRNY